MQVPHLSTEGRTAKPSRIAIGLLLSAWLIGAPVAHAQANIVVNGDFETPVACPAPFLAPAPVVPGWTIELGTVDIVCFTFWMPATGLQSLDLTGTPGSATISQNLATQPGEEYLLRFAMAGNPDPTCDALFEPAVKHMQVRWEGVLVASLQHDSAPHTPADPGWLYHEFTVLATVTSSELEFMDVTPDARLCGATLDDVSVTLIEPVCPPEDDEDGDDDGDGLDNGDESRLLTLLNVSDSDLDGIVDGNDDANGNGVDDEDEDDDEDDDDDDECPDDDEDEDDDDEEDEDDDEDDD